MSYEPRLIISHEDLHENRDLILTFANHKDASRAVKYLEKLLDDIPITIKEVQIVICQPELTKFNSEVRELLRHFKIEYATDY